MSKKSNALNISADVRNVFSTSNLEEFLGSQVTMSLDADSRNNGTRASGLQGGPKTLEDSVKQPQNKIDS